MASYRIIELSNPEALKNFAYKGKKGSFIGMNEDETKSALKSALEGQGHVVKVKWGHTSGPDIETFSGRKIVLEAKGEGSYRQMLGNYFLQSLGEILSSTPDFAFRFQFRTSGRVLQRKLLCIAKLKKITRKLVCAANQFAMQTKFPSLLRLRPETATSFILLKFPREIQFPPRALLGRLAAAY